MGGECVVLVVDFGMGYYVKLMMLFGNNKMCVF